MRQSNLVRAAVLAGLLVLPLALSPATGWAQTATKATDPAAAAPAPKGGEAGPHAAAVEHRIAELHSKLHITAAQASTWDPFAEVMRDNARNMDQTFEQRAGRLKDMTALDNMQSYAELAQAHAQNVQKLAAAFQPLYDAMSPEQKRTADQLFRTYTERAQQRASGHRG